MDFIAIVILSLSLQCIAVTGHTKAWMLLSIGIATMAIRRFITLYTISTAPVAHRGADYLYEIIGVIGSAMMVAEIVLIKPVFLALRNAEQVQRGLKESLKEALSSGKTLKAMLPICASCKKIRDDNGYWQTVEKYISSHTDTSFSHGICPDCVRKLYPEYCEEVLASSATPKPISPGGGTSL